MVSGVSLKGADAALVLLRQSDGHHLPLTLAIKGNYDRLGSIDGIEEDANTRLVLRYFLDALQSGTFVVDEECLSGHHSSPITNMEELFRGFERNMNDGGGAAMLNDHAVVFALIARTVWDAIVEHSPPTDPTVAVEPLFDGSEVAITIYEGLRTEVAGHLVELAAVESFLTSHGLRWHPTEADGQHDSDEMREYLADARQRFADSPAILVGLDRYEEEVSDLLADG